MSRADRPLRREREPEQTALLQAQFLDDPTELDQPPAPEPIVGGVEALPPGCALLVVRRGPNAGARFLLDQEITTAGRHSDNHIVLDHATVSRQHAEFRRDGDEFAVVDLGSLNGTYVNREPTDYMVLTHRDQIHLGTFRLVYLTNPEGTAPTPR